MRDRQYDISCGRRDLHGASDGSTLVFDLAQLDLTRHTEALPYRHFQLLRLLRGRNKENGSERSVLVAEYLIAIQGVVARMIERSPRVSLTNEYARHAPLGQPFDHDGNQVLATGHGEQRSVVLGPDHNRQIAHLLALLDRHYARSILGIVAHDHFGTFRVERRSVRQPVALDNVARLQLQVVRIGHQTHARIFRSILLEDILITTQLNRSGRLESPCAESLYDNRIRSSFVQRIAVLRDKEIFLGQCDSFHGERLFARA